MSRSGSTAKFRQRAPFLFRLAGALDAAGDVSMAELLAAAIAPTGKPLGDFTDEELLDAVERCAAHLKGMRRDT